MSRGRPAKFQGAVLAAVVALLKAHGPSKTREIMAAENMTGRGKNRRGNPLAELRNKDIFPEPMSVSMPTLCKIGKNAGLEFQRGRENPITDAKNASKLTRHAVSLVKQLGASAAVDALRQEGITVCAATLRTLAKDKGVVLVRGPRKAKAGSEKKEAA